mmetsp:Transcript_11336/g.26662  ORF Transcript_11336/g.26662 Transcript_11336/m.26662 type:complete len:219 (-) Transcript_11336:534-1190(-)
MTATGRCCLPCPMGGGVFGCGERAMRTSASGVPCGPKTCLGSGAGEGGSSPVGEGGSMAGGGPPGAWPHRAPGGWAAASAAAAAAAASASGSSTWPSGAAGQLACAPACRLAGCRLCMLARLSRLCRLCKSCDEPAARCERESAPSEAVTWLRAARFCAGNARAADAGAASCAAQALHARGKSSSLMRASGASVRVEQSSAIAGAEKCGGHARRFIVL